MAAYPWDPHSMSPQPRMENQSRTGNFRAALACLALALAGGMAQAQTYPNKPIPFVVPFAAGSATDNLARVLSEQVSTTWKQPVVIDNKPGASGFIAAQQVA